MTQQRRRFHRFPATGVVRIRCETGPQAAAPLIDLSLRGALVGEPQGFAVPLGSCCELEIRLEGQDAEIGMRARVAHREGGRVGFECLHIDIDSITFLKRLVELNLGDPALLERELQALG